MSSILLYTYLIFGVHTFESEINILLRVSLSSITHCVIFKIINKYNAFSKKCLTCDSNLKIYETYKITTVGPKYSIFSQIVCSQIVFSPTTYYKNLVFLFTSKNFVIIIYLNKTFGKRFYIINDLYLSCY